MNIRNCRKCGRMFNYVMGTFVCPSCRESAEQDFQRVKAYVSENPGATMTVVSETCEVPKSQIYQWLREERLELAEGSAIILQCDGCGAPITCGKFCDQCRREVTMGLRDASKSLRKGMPSGDDNSSRVDKDRMRFLNK